MILKIYTTHKQWLAGSPVHERVERSMAYARVLVQEYLCNGFYAVEVHRVESVTFRIWRAGDEKYLLET